MMGDRIATPPVVSYYGVYKDKSCYLKAYAVYVHHKHVNCFHTHNINQDYLSIFI